MDIDHGFDVPWGDVVTDALGVAGALRSRAGVALQRDLDALDSSRDGINLLFKNVRHRVR